MTMYVSVSAHDTRVSTSTLVLSDGLPTLVAACVCHVLCAVCWVLCIGRTTEQLLESGLFASSADIPTSCGGELTVRDTAAVA